MTRSENDTAFGEVIEVIMQNRLEGLAEAMSIEVVLLIKTTSSPRYSTATSAANLRQEILRKSFWPCRSASAWTAGAGDSTIFLWSVCGAR